MPTTPTDLPGDLEVAFDKAFAVINWLGQTGYLLSARIEVRGTTGWHALSASVSGDEIDWLGPHRHDEYEGEEPPWDLLVSLEMSVPVPVWLLGQIATEFREADVDLPGIIVRDGWCRTPLRGEAIEIGVTR